MTCACLFVCQDMDVKMYLHVSDLGQFSLFFFLRELGWADQLSRAWALYEAQHTHACAI